MNSLKNSPALTRSLYFFLLELHVNFSGSGGRDSINQNPQFLSVTVCDSLSGLRVQRENPSLSNVSSCLCALIYISHCSWEGVQ